MMVTRPPPWTEENDTQLKRLVGRGYSIIRLGIAMKRPVTFLRRRSMELGITLKKQQRLPVNERSFGGSSPRNTRVRNTSE
jgi:hypothetical protein